MLLRDELPAVLHHHEHFDGSGYPHGIAGDRIPLHARILAVADAYDAMTTGRVYEPVHSQAQAFAVLREEAGAQFDPDIVECFIGAAEHDDPGIEEFLPASLRRRVEDGSDSGSIG